MRKNYKFPVNARTTITRVTTPEVIEIVENTEGECIALLAESPSDPTNISTPITVSVNGTPRIFQNDSSPVIAGRFKIKSVTVNNLSGDPQTEYLPVLEFNRADLGASGTCDYYGVGTTVSAEYLESLREWFSPIRDCNIADDLQANYPATTNIYKRGYPGDQAFLLDDTMMVSNGTQWVRNGTSQANSAPVLDPVSTQYLTVGSTLDIALKITDEDPFGCSISASSNNEDVCPNSALSVAGVGPNRTGHISALSVGGAVTIRFTVIDASGLQTFQEFTLNSVTVPTYALTVSSSGSGITTPGTNNVQQGASVHFTFIPSVGYHVADVQVDGISVGSVASYDLNNISTAHTIDVVYAINTYNITSSFTGSGTVSPTQSIEHGGSYVVTITANSDQFIKNVVVDGNSLGAQASPYTYNFNNITASHTIAATFGNYAPTWSTQPTVASYTGDGAIINYQFSDPESASCTVEYQADGGAWTSMGSKNSGTAYQLTLSGLVGASHTLKLRVNDGVNAAVESNQIDVNIPAPATAPTGLTVTGQALQNALVWAAVSTSQVYDVQVSNDGATGWADLATGLAATNYTHTGLGNSVQRYYRVRARNQGGSSAYSNGVSGTTLSLDVPTGLTITGKTSGNTVSWSPASGAATYDVQWSNDGATGWTNLTTGTASTTVNHNNIGGHVTKFYRVRSNNAGGSSAYCTAVSGTSYFVVDTLVGTQGAAPVFLGENNANILKAGSFHYISPTGYQFQLQPTTPGSYQPFQLFQANITPYSGLSWEFEIVSLTLPDAMALLDCYIYTDLGQSSKNVAVLRFGGTQTIQIIINDNSGAQTNPAATYTSTFAGIWKMVLTSTTLSIYKNGSLVGTVNLTNFVIPGTATCYAMFNFELYNANNILGTIKNFKVW